MLKRYGVEQPEETQCGNLTEFKGKTEHYFEDKQGRRQGMEKRWYKNGQLTTYREFVNGEIHGIIYSWDGFGVLGLNCFAENSMAHGEYKDWNGNGEIKEHHFYLRGDIITDEVRKIVEDIDHITDEEKFLIMLKWGIKTLPPIPSIIV